MRINLILASVFLAGGIASAQFSDLRDGGLQKFKPLPAPVTKGLAVKAGDRLAICGDSITEQKMYSRLIEDYVTMCVPELGITVRQYGWSGERAPGFLSRMTNDCLRFKPTVATTCYGMNDHQYRPYEPAIGQAYRESSLAIIEAFKANGVRFILGSPGCVGKMPAWVKSATGTVEDLNLSLCTLRNIDIELARQEKVGFADVFWPMLTAGVEGQRRFGTNFAIAGGDGVHPDWAGQTVMAYAFLKAMGFNGELATFSVDLKRGRLRVSQGHEVLSAADGEYQIKSSRYPFAACLPPGLATAGYPVCNQDDPTKSNSIRAGEALVPFCRDLNRFVLVAKNAKSPAYRVEWNGASKTFNSAQLAGGINLAEEFPCNPFCEAFARVDAAVAAKQAFETRQIKQLFHGPEGRANMTAVVARSEAERQPLAEAIQAAFVPVTHTLRLTPQN